jgi:hypothetical protein
MTVDKGFPTVGRLQAPLGAQKPKVFAPALAAAKAAWHPKPPNGKTDPRSGEREPSA